MFSLSQFPLPYADTDLAPYMSDETLHLHHGRHVATYIEKLNGLIAGTKYADMSLRDIIIQSHADGATGIFNNSAQVFNHDFFFHCMKPNGGGAIPEQIAAAFGGADEFRTKFRDAAINLFGSGWIWLARIGDALKIIPMQNAGTPITDGAKPILTLDVWEHAYYVDYQNRRAEYVDAFLNNLANWEFALKNM